MGQALGKMVALLAVVTVLNSTQCLNFCAVRPCDAASVASARKDSTSHCHHSPASSKSEPTNRSSSCTHQPLLVTEKLTKVGTGELSTLPVLVGHSASSYGRLTMPAANIIGSSPQEGTAIAVILRI